MYTASWVYCNCELVTITGTGAPMITSPIAWIRLRRRRPPTAMLYRNQGSSIFAPEALLRIAAVSVAHAAFFFVVTVSSGQSIELSLNVFYANPTNLALGGTWQLVGKSSAAPSTFGILDITTNIANINNDVTDEGPRGIVNGTVAAGFQIVSDVNVAGVSPDPAYHQIEIGELALNPLTPGSEEDLFYGVGNIVNGAPDFPGNGAATSIGPTFVSLSNTQGIPWASTPDFNGDSTWDIAATLLSGTFSGATAPAFVAGSIGDIFTSVPAANNSIGNKTLASAITTVVRTNVIAIPGDFNHNGIVDASDYVLWRDGLGTTFQQSDYAVWRQNFGETPVSGPALRPYVVPEPSAVLTFISTSAVACLLCFARRTRSRGGL
jgi:hypothetical protein